MVRMGTAEVEVAQEQGREAEKQLLARVVVALGEAESFQELMGVVAAPEFEWFEGCPEVQLAEEAARKRLEAEAVAFADADLERKLAEESARVWRERYEGLRTACEALTAASGSNAVDFYRAVSRIRQLLV